MRQTNVCSNRAFVLGVHASPQQVYYKMKKKKRHVLNNNFIERKFIKCYQRNG